MLINWSGNFGVGETRSLLGDGDGGGYGFPVGDRGQGRGYFHHRGSGTGSVIPGPAPLPFLMDLAKYRAAKDGSEKKTDILKQLSDEMWRRINLDGRVQFIGVILFGPVKGPKILKSFRSPVVNDWQCYKSMIKLFEGECGSINTECGDKAFRALANLCNNKVSLTAAKEAFGAACMVKM
ncbi:hypothetical protein TEA_004751 [Camellia sinensis var. sinensis]|uniref:Legumain prodomain domain-containing protein n=1 Tax=Camellia sinensis var. sinensis TaxID=542762 RepID=A0A4S4EE84_CAMSN|nr:hypothetical protein TEA_004751 [Camellia sinensis var. sinensis]